MEIYDCGCKLHLYTVEYGEAREDQLSRPTMVADYRPCPRHDGRYSEPPRDSRLVKVRGENEAFLNE